MGPVGDANEDLVQRAVDAWNAREREAFLACYADELIVWTGEDEHVVVGPDEHWAAALTWFERFPAFRETIQGMLAEGDEVFLRTRYAGIHEGSGAASSRPVGGSSGTPGRC